MSGIEGNFEPPIGTQPISGTVTANQGTPGASPWPIAIDQTGDNNDVDVIASVLPTGAATSTKQDTGNTSLASIDTKLTNPLPVSGSISVSNFPATQPISAASLPLPTGAATSVLQTSGNTSLSSIDSKLTNPLPISASSLPLPTGASTSALQTTGNTSLASIDTKTPALGQAAMAASVPVVIASNQSDVPAKSAQGSSTSAAWTGSTPINTAITISTNGYPTARLTMLNTTGNGAVTLEGSIDGGSTYNYPINVLIADPALGAQGPTTSGIIPMSSLTSNVGISFIANCVALTNVRARLSTLPVGGTINIALQAVACSAESLVPGTAWLNNNQAIPITISGISTVLTVTSSSAASLPSQVSQGTAANLNATVVQATPGNLNATAVGSLADNGVAIATNRIGVVPATAAVTYPALTSGRNAAERLGTDGLLWVAAMPPLKPASYSAAVLGLAAAAAATDIFVISGNATTTTLVTGITISGTQTVGSAIDIILIKRSAADTGGTSASVTAVPNDSSNSAASTAVLSYTANPGALGAAVGNVRTFKISLPATSATSEAPLFIRFADSGNGQPIVLRGTAQQLAINLNGQTVAGGSFDICANWLEV